MCVCVCLCLYLAAPRVEVVSVGRKEQVCDPPPVARGQQCKQFAILARVDAHAARVRAARVQGLAWAERHAGDDATLSLLLHCGHTKETHTHKTLVTT